MRGEDDVDTDAVGRAEGIATSTAVDATSTADLDAAAMPTMMPRTIPTTMKRRSSTEAPTSVDARVIDRRLSDRRSPDDSECRSTSADAATGRSPGRVARLRGRAWGRFAELWVPESLTDARVDPGRRGAVVLLIIATLAAIVTAVGVWRDRPQARPVESVAVAPAGTRDPGNRRGSGSPVAGPGADAVGSAAAAVAVREAGGGCSVGGRETRARGAGPIVVSVTGEGAGTGRRDGAARVPAWRTRSPRPGAPRRTRTTPGSTSPPGWPTARRSSWGHRCRRARGRGQRCRCRGGRAGSVTAPAAGPGQPEHGRCGGPGHAARRRPGDGAEHPHLAAGARPVRVGGAAAGDQRDRAGPVCATVRDGHGVTGAVGARRRRRWREEDAEPPVDLRLALPAVAVWIGCLVGLVAGAMAWIVAAALAALAAVVLAAGRCRSAGEADARPVRAAVRASTAGGGEAAWADRPVGPAGPLRRVTRRARGWCAHNRWGVLAAALCCATAVCISALLTAANRDDRLVVAAHSRAWAVLEIEIGGIPEPESAGFRAPDDTSDPDSAGPAWRVDGTVMAARVAGASWTAATPVVVHGAGPGWGDVTPGAVVETSGRLSPQDRAGTSGVQIRARSPPGELVAAPWWQRAAQRVRQTLSANASALGGDAAGLLPGLVVGDTSGISEQLDRDAKATGVAHLLAVSGSHFAIVCGAVVLALRRVGPRWAAAGGALTLVALVVLVGAQPSVLRAAVMGAITLVALLTGRARTCLPALAACVIGLLLLDPLLALSVGFALSVLATGGLVLLAPAWSTALQRRGCPRGWADALCIPVAAQLVTTPVIVAISGTVPVFGVLANLLVAPVVGARADPRRRLRGGRSLVARRRDGASPGPPRCRWSWIAWVGAPRRGVAGRGAGVAVVAARPRRARGRHRRRARPAAAATVPAAGSSPPPPARRWCSVPAAVVVDGWPAARLAARGVRGRPGRRPGRDHRRGGSGDGRRRGARSRPRRPLPRPPGHRDRAAARPDAPARRPRRRAGRRPGRPIRGRRAGRSRPGAGVRVGRRPAPRRRRRGARRAMARGHHVALGRAHRPRHGARAGLRRYGIRSRTTTRSCCWPRSTASGSC